MDDPVLHHLSPKRAAWLRFKRNKGALVGGVFLLLVAGMAISAPWLASLRGIDPQIGFDFAHMNAPPSAAFWLGTDGLGRDILTQLLYAARISLIFGLGATLMAALIGTVIGLIAGYFGGWLDSLLMRLTDGIIALPLLPLLIVLAAIDWTEIGLPSEIAHSEGFALTSLMLLIALFGWTRVSRLVRAGTLAAREETYVLAARALGARDGRIMLRHILPNITGPLIVSATLSIGSIILLEATLSFLGFGVPPTTPSWGAMLRDAEALIFGADTPWLAIWPGLALFFTVISFNFLGDGLQDALNPKLAERGRV